MAIKHLVSSVLAAAVLFFSPASSIGDQSALSVACNLPLTGDLAVYGQAIQEGAVMALEELSLKGMKFDWQDNQSSARQAALIAARQLESKPDVYMSGLKPQYMAIHDAVVRAGVPHFPWIFDTNIRPAGERNFRNLVNFKVEPPLFFKFALERKASKVAVIYVQLPHTDEEYLGAVVPGLKDRGVSDVLVEAYDMNKTDFRDLALRVSRFKPDVLILSAFQASFPGLIRALRNLNLIGPDNTVASYDLIDALPILSPAEGEGISVSAPGFMVHPTREYEAWKSRFRNRYKKEPLYMHVYSYDTVTLLGKASVGKTGKHEDLASAIQHAAVQGVAGKLSFDSDGDVATAVDLGVVRNGRIQ